MNNHFLQLALVLGTTFNMGAFVDMRHEFERMESRIAQMHEKMRDMFSGSFSSSNQNQLSVSSQDAISIEKKDGQAVISIDLPGVKRLDAQIEDDELTVSDLDNNVNSVRIAVEDRYVHVEVQYEMKKETKGDKHEAVSYSAFQSARTFPVSYQLDFSDSNKIDISYDADKLVIRVPVIEKAVQKIPVTVTSKAKRSMSSSSSFSSSHEARAQASAGEDMHQGDTEGAELKPKRIKFTDFKKSNKEL